MSRPTRVSFETFPLYNQLHTRKEKMYSGVELTILYPIKETEHFYMSIPVWVHCASTFKKKKKYLDKLSVDIPTVTNENSVKFLDKHCWKKNDIGEDSEYAVELLKKQFPDKEFQYFYELDSLISAYCHGTFIRYDDDGNVEEQSEYDIDQQKYYNSKYNKFIDVPEIVKLRKEWTDTPNDDAHKDIRTKRLRKYIKAEREYVQEHMSEVDTFIDVCSNAVCYPVAFERGTAEWSKEKYGREVAYAKAGEIYFVVTDKTIYYNITRHY